MQDSKTVAILALVQSIEVQCQTIRILMGMPGNTTAMEQVPFKPAEQPMDTQYMDDKEEEKLDAQIEIARQDSLTEAEIVQRRWLAQRAAMDAALEGTAI